MARDPTQPTCEWGLCRGPGDVEGWTDEEGEEVRVRSAE